MWWKSQAVGRKVLQYIHGLEGKERRPDPGEGSISCFEERRKILYGKKGHFYKPSNPAPTSNKCLTEGVLVVSENIYFMPSDKEEYFLISNSSPFSECYILSFE